jgi:hypothetical protein
MHSNRDTTSSPHLEDPPLQVFLQISQHLLARRDGDIVQLIPLYHQASLLQQQQQQQWSWNKMGNPSELKLRATP